MMNNPTMDVVANEERTKDPVVPTEPKEPTALTTTVVKAGTMGTKRTLVEDSSNSNGTNDSETEDPTVSKPALRNLRAQIAHLRTKTPGRRSICAVKNSRLKAAQVKMMLKADPGVEVITHNKRGKFPFEKFKKKGPGVVHVFAQQIGDKTRIRIALRA